MKQLVILVIGLALAAGCGGRAVERVAEHTPSIAETPEDSWRRLAGRRVFFGHQSVGENIVDGIRGILASRPDIGCAISDLPDPARLTEPGLYHARIGRNGDPAAKTDHFARLVDEGLSADIALHKYCYVDFDERTDVEAVFEHYRATMRRLADAHPEVTFVHVTVPLTEVRMGPRDWLNKLLGRTPGEYATAMVRARFNDMLRREYDGRAPVFDLAAIESTRPDGAREGFSFKGGTYESLAPEYSADGAHLNERGRAAAAAPLLALLADLAAR